MFLIIYGITSKTNIQNNIKRKALEFMYNDGCSDVFNNKKMKLNSMAITVEVYDRDVTLDIHAESSSESFPKCLTEITTIMG